MKDFNAPVLGSYYKDKITGFSGTAVGHVEYLTGCNQTLVVPKVDSEGKLRNGEWFDDQRLELVVAETPVRLNNGSTPGCDAAPPRSY